MKLLIVALVSMLALACADEKDEVQPYTPPDKWKLGGVEECYSVPSGITSRAHRTIGPSWFYQYFEHRFQVNYYETLREDGRAYHKKEIILSANCDESGQLKSLRTMRTVVFRDIDGNLMAEATMYCKGSEAFSDLDFTEAINTNCKENP